MSDQMLAENMRLTHRLGEWFKALGVDERQSSSLAVDLADIVAAGAKTHEAVQRLLELNSHAGKDAAEGLAIAGIVDAQLFTEMKGHLESLEQAWPEVLQKLAKRAP